MARWFFQKEHSVHIGPRSNETIALYTEPTSFHGTGHSPDGNAKLGLHGGINAIFLFHVLSFPSPLAQECHVGTFFGAAYSPFLSAICVPT
jgi:hypothetical protein